MINLVIILAIIIAIGISYKTNINMGFFAIAFAYIIGCFLLNIKPAQVIGMWPTNVFFVILATSLFYNFAFVNGTLEKLSGYLLYACRKIPAVLPYAIFFVATLIAAVGAGYFTVMVLITPLALLITKKAGMDPMVGALSSNYGAMIGASFMVSANGVVYRSLMESGGYGNSAFTYSIGIFVVSLIVAVFMIGGLILYSKKKNIVGNNLDIKKPEPFDKKQKINLYLIIIMVITVLIPPILHLIAPKNSVITFINSRIDIGLIAIVFATIASMAHLADGKKVIAKVPWNTLLLVSGVGILISVAVKAGTIKLLASWVSGSIPLTLIPIAVTGIGIVMSFFASLIGVVIPALFPVIPSIAQATGINPMLLYICIVIGAQASTISPFSTGGAMVMGYSETDEERNSMFKKELFRALPVCSAAALLMTVIISFIIK